MKIAWPTARTPSCLLLRGSLVTETKQLCFSRGILVASEHLSFGSDFCDLPKMDPTQCRGRSLKDPRFSNRTQGSVIPNKLESEQETCALVQENADIGAEHTNPPINPKNTKRRNKGHKYLAEFRCRLCSCPQEASAPRRHVNSRVLWMPIWSVCSRL